MSERTITILITVGVGLSLLVAAGCENDAQTGALIGTGAGAGIGQLAGGDSEATLIGAAVGGGIGYLLGNEGDKKAAAVERDSMRYSMNSETVYVTNSNDSMIAVKLQRSGPGFIGPRGEYYPRLPHEDQLRPVYGF